MDPIGLLGLISRGQQYQYIACIKWLAHFQVFAAVPLTGPVPSSQLASICAVPERQLQSMTRMAITSGCLCEPEPGELAHNGVS
jgi:6-hydroxytryprostatin B O-methyltransferase